MRTVQERGFYLTLFRNTFVPLGAIILGTMVYLLLMALIDHQLRIGPYLILFLALIKTLIIARTTLRQLSKLVRACHSSVHVLWVFGLLIAISILSFATDYNCLYLFDDRAFEGTLTASSSFVENLFQFLYFSLITFSTVGYGDLVPVSIMAKLLVMIEIFLSFLIVVYALTNLKNIHLNE